MEETDLISIIIPVYNAEEYLERCIKSIVDQTYRNLEIILIDDGSPDRCGEICDEWVVKDKRIKTVHIENGGTSIARNVGLEVAGGRFIAFIDDDDYIDNNMIHCLYDALVRVDADVAMCGVMPFVEEEYLWGKQGKMSTSSWVIDAQVMTGREALRYINSKSPYEVIWNKLYKRHLFDGIRFPSGRLGEDIEIMHQLLFRCHMLVQIPDRLYHYQIRKGSQSESIKTIKRLEGIESFYNRIRFFEINDIHECLNDTAYIMLDTYFRLVKDYSIRSVADKEQFRKYRKMVRYAIWRYGSNIRKVLILRFEMPKLFDFLFRLKRKLFARHSNDS